MRLLYTPIAGYVHTVEAVVNYARLRERVLPEPTRPYDADTPLPTVNPAGKVPTLVLEDGRYLAGGPVIYEYLDTLHGRRRLHPSRGARRWEVLRRAWMADVLFDQLVTLIVEGWTDKVQQRAGTVDRAWRKVIGILDQMERDVASHGALCIAQLRGVGALAFLDLKIGQIGTAVVGVDPMFDWRKGRPALAGWFRLRARNRIFREPLTGAA